MTLTDDAVAKYIGCTPEQVRIMKLHKLACSDCTNVHPSFPSIKAFHSPCCKSNQKCAECGAVMTDIMVGHEVGLICWDCHDGRTTSPDTDLKGE